jgi:hypothetical protein
MWKDRERNRKIMNPYEKLAHEQRTWDLKETAAFFGYTCKYFYTLVRQGKLDGCWVKINGDYRFCPAKIKELMEKGFNGNGGPSKPSDPSGKPPKKDHDDEAV